MNFSGIKTRLGIVNKNSLNNFEDMNGRNEDLNFYSWIKVLC